MISLDPRSRSLGSDPGIHFWDPWSTDNNPPGNKRKRTSKVENGLTDSDSGLESESVKMDLFTYL